MADKLYMLSFDKDAGGRHFFYTGRTNSPSLAYGTVGYTTTLGEAKPYKTRRNAMKIAIRLVKELGFKRIVYVHEWEPKMFDSTKIVIWC